ncbi:MAG: hypothetical protein ACFB21_05440 [Opitutales bacterium]
MSISKGWIAAVSLGLLYVTLRGAEPVLDEDPRRITLKLTDGRELELQWHQLSQADQQWIRDYLEEIGHLKDSRLI